MSSEKAPAQTVPARILHWAAQQPERDAYVFCSPRIGRSTLTRRNLKDMTFTFAGRLARVGVRIGDVVCNTLQVCVCMFSVVVVVCVVVVLVVVVVCVCVHVCVCACVFVCLVWWWCV